MTYSLSIRAEAKRFWRHVEKTDTCWLWTASLSPAGYSRFRTRFGYHAHTFAYLLLVGPIPRDLELDHLCRVRRCVAGIPSSQYGAWHRGGCDLRQENALRFWASAFWCQSKN